MLNNFTLLYVEDDISMQEYMKELLEDEVKEIYQAFNGQEGLNMFKEKSPDIILSDISMPIMDGFEMAKKIKDIDYDQVIIFFTALTDIDDIKRAIDINVNGFINKPLSNVEDFFKYIESKLNILKLRSTQKELANLRLEKEKLDFIVETIREISHHWKQPLSAISITASFFSYKYNNESDIELTKEDILNAEVIIEQVNKLATVLEEIESISGDSNIDVNRIKNILKISNPIYE